jgi:hypothetical protein
LSAISPRRAQAAAANYFRRAGLTVVVVGDAQQVYDRLKAIAPVRLVAVEGAPLAIEDLSAPTGPVALDRTQLVTRSDSFRVVVQGNPMGIQVGTLHADSGVQVEATNIGGFLKQDTRVVFDTTDWSVKEVHQTGSVQGQQLQTDLVYAGGRVKGTAMTPQPTGPKTITVDTTVVAGTIDENALSVLLPALPLEAGKTLALNVFVSSQAAVIPASLKVSGPESVTVPAGTFDALRVDVTGLPQGIAMWVSIAAPRRVVKIAPVGTPVVIELVK